MRNVIFLIIWSALFGIATDAHAAILVKKNTSSIVRHTYTSPGDICHLSRWQQLGSYRNILVHGSQIPGRKNRNGILSLSVIGFFLLALAAVTIITPTIPSGLGALLYASSIGTSVLAIIFGRIGIKKDYKRGFARAGFIMGIVLLSVVLLMSLLILTAAGTLAF